DVFDGQEDLTQGGGFGGPSLYPDVVLVHSGAVFGLERRLALFDESLGVGELAAQFGSVTGVGDELVAGEAGVAAVADLCWWQHAPPIGQDPVGSFVQLQDVVEIAGIERRRAPIGGDLLEAQELPFGGLGQGQGVVHGHLWADVAQVAHDHVQRDTSVEQVGGRGVSEPVGLADGYQVSVAVGDAQQGGQSRQDGVQGGRGVWVCTVAVLPLP